MVEWGNYAEAYRAIHDKLEEILAKLDYPSDPAVQDIINRADRLLGIIYGDVGQLLQRTTTRDLLIQLRHAGTEIDPRQIRTLTSSDVVDISDRAARDLGKATVEQADASKLKATITPSGDIARKAEYDRTPTPQAFVNYTAMGAGTPLTERWRYTVPTGKKAMHNVIFGLANLTPATYTAGAAWELSLNGGASWNRYGDLVHWTGAYTYFTITVTFYMIAGHIVRGLSYNDDTTSHGVKVGSLFLEFDA